ncbi:MAG: hypothetical protein JWO97_2747 [Acidobacteria bacterium]|nr:hypothetical protein [Acidobacteriota bacterium]
MRVVIANEGVSGIEDVRRFLECDAVFLRVDPRFLLVPLKPFIFHVKCSCISARTGGFSSPNVTNDRNFAVSSAASRSALPS